MAGPLVSPLFVPDAYHLSKLEESFKERKRKNPRYSMRAFAAHLGMHPSALSRVLKGTQPISEKNGLRIVKTLGLSKEEQRLFLQSLARRAWRESCASLGKKIGADDLKASPQVVSDEIYGKIASLACISIIQLTFTKDFQADPAQIAKRLGLSTKEVEGCIASLLEAGMLARKDGRLVGANTRLTSIDPAATSRARKNLQKEIMLRALESIESDPIEKRGHYGTTMAIDPANLPLARKMIAEFVESLCDFLGNGELTEIYQLGVQLFPLSREEK